MLIWRPEDMSKKERWCPQLFDSITTGQHVDVSSPLKQRSAWTQHFHRTSYKHCSMTLTTETTSCGKMVICIYYCWLFLVLNSSSHSFILCWLFLFTLIMWFSVKRIPEAFVSGSHGHQRQIEVQKEVFQEVPRDLQRLIETRWPCRYNDTRQWGTDCQPPTEEKYLTER